MSLRLTPLCLRVVAGLTFAVASWAELRAQDLTPPPAPLVGPPPPPPEKKESSKWSFSLLPKALQKKPSLDFHIITEMTDDGRRVTAPTGSHPAYYIEQAGKFAQLGNNTPGNEHPPAIDQLEKAMQRALAASYYQPTTPQAKPAPDLVVVFNYGSFARFSTDAADFQQMVAMEQLSEQQQQADPTAAPMDPFIPSGGERSVESLLPMVMSGHVERKDVLDRADLIGGAKFARQLAQVLDKEASYEESNGGSSGPDSPFNRFVNDNETAMALVEESFSSCYFVVATALDYKSLAKGKRVVLWRTKMTVNSLGISMSESLPALVVNAGPYFGKDMTDSVTITRKLSREGRVEIGTPTVVEDNGAPPPPPPAKTPEASKKP